MTTYKPRFTRREGGGYDASYGRGERKITGTVLKASSGKWYSPELTGEWDKARDVKAAWGEWAEAKYNGDDSGDRHLRTCTLGPPPAPSKSSPPPPPSVPAAIKSEPDGIQKSPDNLYLADPFNGDFFERVDGRDQCTPIGALMEVYNWMESHIDRIERSNTYPWARVVEVLRRLYPDDARFQGDAK